jgi:hypothetical protein
LNPWLTCSGVICRVSISGNWARLVMYVRIFCVYSSPVMSSNGIALFMIFLFAEMLSVSQGIWSAKGVTVMGFHVLARSA